MENLEGAVDSAPLVDKVEDDGFQFELQSLGEIERQYADHSVMRDAQLTILREKVAVSFYFTINIREISYFRKMT